MASCLSFIFFCCLNSLSNTLAVPESSEASKSWLRKHFHRKIGPCTWNFWILWCNVMRCWLISDAFQVFLKKVDRMLIRGKQNKEGITNKVLLGNSLLFHSKSPSPPQLDVFLTYPAAMLLNQYWIWLYNCERKYYWDLSVPRNDFPFIHCEKWESSLWKERICPDEENNPDATTF